MSQFSVYPGQVRLDTVDIGSVNNHVYYYSMITWFVTYEHGQYLHVCVYVYISCFILEGILANGIVACICSYACSCLVSFMLVL